MGQELVMAEVMVGMAEQMVAARVITRLVEVEALADTLVMAVMAAMVNTMVYLDHLVQMAAVAEAGVVRVALGFRLTQIITTVAVGEVGLVFMGKELLV